MGSLHEHYLGRLYAGIVCDELMVYRCAVRYNWCILHQLTAGTCCWFAIYNLSHNLAENRAGFQGLNRRELYTQWYNIETSCHTVHGNKGEHLNPGCSGTIEGDILCIPLTQNEYGEFLGQQQEKEHVHEKDRT